MPSLYDRFTLVSDFELAGDQARAIRELGEGLERGDRHQVLLGVTGSGKTFTMAQTIARVNRPTLVMVHNKTLAAQLYQEFRRFFPENAVEYFVSYYDYYQPEAYVPSTDSYIEKEATINEEIDRMRLSATRSLFDRRDAARRAGDGAQERTRDGRCRRGARCPAGVCGATRRSDLRRQHVRRLRAGRVRRRHGDGRRACRRACARAPRVARESDRSPEAGITLKSQLSAVNPSPQP